MPVATDDLHANILRKKKSTCFNDMREINKDSIYSAWASPELGAFLRVVKLVTGPSVFFLVTSMEGFSDYGEAL